MINQTVVVTDDDASCLEMMETLLSDEGYSCIVCNSTRAFETIRRTQPDIAIVNVSFRMSQFGWGLVDQLASNAATAHIPLMVCSTDPRLHIHAAQHGVQPAALMIKPFRLDDVLATIERLLQQQLAEVGFLKERTVYESLLPTHGRHTTR